MGMAAAQQRIPKIPLIVKVVYTAFVCVLVWNYWLDYGPTNFLYFCDVALFFTLAAMWTESPLLAGIPAVGIIFPQMLWVFDFVAGVFGWFPFGMTVYMFDDNIPLQTRGLSLFHGWLPFLLIWLVHRLGYDRRSMLVWTGIAWVLVFVCYFWMPPPPAPPDQSNLPVNINYVWGLSDKAPQDLMPANAWFAMLVVALPLIVFLPTHLALRKLYPPPSR